MLKKILKKADTSFSFHAMAKIIGVLLIIYLLMRTERIWDAWISKIGAILQPFVIGFVISYVMHPIVKMMQKKGVPKSISIALLWSLVIVILVFLTVLLLPILYDKINAFIISLIDAVTWISDQIKRLGRFDDFSLINSLTISIVNMLEAYDDWMPELVSSLPSLMTSLLDFITNALFTIIIAIYMLFDFDHIKLIIKSVIRYFIPHCDSYLHEIDVNVLIYLKSMAFLILIRFVEYSAFYYCVGHRDWLIIGLITALGAIIPYIGGSVANAIGILSGLMLPFSNLIALIVGILILSNVDNYVISPIVHERRSSVGPLISIFAVFAGGIIGGIAGIMISLPLVIALKSVMGLYKERHHDKFKSIDNIMKKEL